MLAALTGCGGESGSKTKPDGGVHAPDAVVPRKPVADASSAVHQDARVPSKDSGAAVPKPVPDAHVVLDATVIGVSPCTGDPPVMKWRDFDTNVELAPDFHCYDAPERDAGAPDARADAGDASTGSATLHLAPLSPLLIGLSTVDVFFEPSTLGSPAVTRTFGADAGTVSFPLQAGTTHVSLHLHALRTANPSYDLAEIHEYALPVLGGNMVEGFVTLEASRKLAINLALDGEQDDPSKALIASYARDCAGHPVSGAEFSLIDGETNRPVPVGSADGAPHSSYARFGLPTATCTFTTNQQSEASWMMVNAPVNVTNGMKTRSYRLRFMGRRRESDAVPVVLREREVELFAGGTTFVRVDR